MITTFVDLQSTTTPLADLAEGVRVLFPKFSGASNLAQSTPAEWRSNLIEYLKTVDPSNEGRMLVVQEKPGEQPRIDVDLAIANLNSVPSLQVLRMGGDPIPRVTQSVQPAPPSQGRITPRFAFLALLASLPCVLITMVWVSIAKSPSSELAHLDDRSAVPPSNLIPVSGFPKTSRNTFPQQFGQSDNGVGTAPD